MSRVEKNYLITRSVVILFVFGKKDVGSEVWEHFANAVDENVGVLIAVVGINMFLNQLIYKVYEGVRISLGGEFGCHHIGVSLVPIKSVVQERYGTKLLAPQIVTEHGKEVQNQSIYKRGGVLEFLFKFQNLSAHQILLTGLILIYIVVIKNISIGLEELVGPKVVIEFLNGHAFWRVCHYHNIIMCLG